MHTSRYAPSSRLALGRLDTLVPNLLPRRSTSAARRGGWRDGELSGLAASLARPPGSKTSSTSDRSAAVGGVTVLRARSLELLRFGTLVLVDSRIRGPGSRWRVPPPSPLEHAYLPRTFQRMSALQSGRCGRTPRSSEQPHSSIAISASEVEVEGSGTPARYARAPLLSARADRADLPAMPRREPGSHQTIAFRQALRAAPCRCGARRRPADQVRCPFWHTRQHDSKARSELPWLVTTTRLEIPRALGFQPLAHPQTPDS